MSTAALPSAPTSNPTPATSINGSGGNSNGTDKAFEHIQDLQAKSQRGYDTTASVSTLLKTAEGALGQAQFLLDIRRPDLAYVEYLRASEIVVGVIPAHKDKIDFFHDQHGEKRYGLLQKQIRARDEQFTNIKGIIINNNKRSGAQPTDYKVRVNHAQTESSVRSEEPMRAPIPRSNSVAHRHSLNGVDKIKPSVSPKPDRLHGRAISNATAGTNGANVELTDRFARLRMSAGGWYSGGAQTRPESRASKSSLDSSPVTMPNVSDYQHTPNVSTDSLSRVRSQPQGPRGMPDSAPAAGHQYPLRLPLDTKVAAAMPKAPSPTYSPARNMNIQGNITAPRHSARSLASTDRRTMSSASHAAPNGVSQSGEYFPSQSPANGSYVQPERGPIPRRKSVHHPAETRISNERLYDYLVRHDILLIDMRSRDSFDEGHIFARNVICIEPMVLRPGMSAEEVQDSLVLSPEIEQELFLHRDQFELVVYYDGSTQSETFLSTPRTEPEAKLKYLHEALYDYNLDKPLQRPPILLVGGLDAWADLVGSQALAASQTLTKAKAGRPIERRPLTTTNSSGSQLRVPKRRLRDYNPLDEEEEAKWRERARVESVAVPQTPDLIEEPEEQFIDEGVQQAAIEQSGAENDPGSAIREFIERFPDAGTLEQQSRNRVQRMPSRDAPQPPLPPAKVPLYQYPPPPPPSAFPQPPKRPAPAAPRMSYTGVSERSVSQNQPHPRSVSQLAPYIPPKYLVQNLRLPRTGLVNFGVTCYMNSTLQALSATTPLSVFFLDDHYHRLVQRENWKGSKGVLPELYSNVVRSVWKGDSASIRPSTFRNFCGRLNREWSIDRQQDAKEFFDFLVDCLHEDLNSMWQCTPLRALTEQEEANRERMPKTVAAKVEWSRYTHREQSFLTQLFGGQHASRLRCTTCGFCSTTYEAFYSISVEIPQSRSLTRRPTLDDCLRSYCAEEMLAGDEVWKCPSCKKQREATKQITLTRAPQFLVVHFKRFSASHAQSARKVRAAVDFPLHEFDLSPYVLSPPSAQEREAIARDYGPEHLKAEASMTPPYNYECYSVVRHIGGTLASGHYTCAARDRARDCWRMFNDQRVVDFQPGSLARGNELQNEEAYIVFYQRTTPGSSGARGSGASAGEM